jgi:hypothetical protein
MTAENTARVVRIRELSGAIHSAEEELVGLLAELHEHEGWCGHGYRSLEHWLSVNAGFTLAEARQRAALADRHQELPHLMGALGRGELSLGAARAAARVATAANDEAVTEVATTATAQQAARVFATMRRIEESESPPPHPPEHDLSSDAVGPPDPGGERGPSTWCSTWWDDLQHLEVRGRLDAHAGAVLRCGLEAARAHLASQRDGARVTNVEALVHMAESMIDTANAAGLRNRQQQRFAVHVTIDAEVLTGRLQGAGVLDDNTPVDAEAVRSWLDGATLDGAVLHRGRPVYLGRTRRIASPAIRRALQLRDRGCAYPGCDRTDHLHAHHAQAWSEGGTTDVDHMVLLCSRHHRLHHDGEFQVTLHDGHPHFGTTEGRPIVPRGPDIPPGPLPRTPHPRPPRTGEPLTTYALDVLLHHLLTAT